MWLVKTNSLYFLLITVQIEASVIADVDCNFNTVMDDTLLQLNFICC